MKLRDNRPRIRRTIEIKFEEIVKTINVVIT